MKKVIKKLASLLMVTVFVITGTTFQMLAGALSESVINGKQKLYFTFHIIRTVITFREVVLEHQFTDSLLKSM